MEDEGVGHRDTLVAMMAPAGAGTVAEREAAAAEEGGSDEEEATVASASDSGGSESDPGEGIDSEKENEDGEGPRGARRAGGGASAAWMPTASPRATRTWAGRMRVPVFQRPGAAAPPPAPKRMRPYGVPSATGEEAQKRRRRESGSNARGRSSNGARGRRRNRDGRGTGGGWTGRQGG